MYSPPNTFRINSWPMFRLIWCVGILLLFLDALIAFTTIPIRLPPYHYLIIAFMIVIGTAAWSGLECLLYRTLVPVRVTMDGVRGGSWWLFLPSTVLSWAEMEKVTPVPFTRSLGIPYIRIRSFHKGRPLVYIPLFLMRYPEFLEAVRDAASPLNPLRQSLENDGEAAERTKIPAG